jgi:hypothetical protein
MAYKTKYTPENPQKYVGNSKNIICRSLWERKFCKYLDTNENIIRWASEEIKIPYVSTIDKTIHHYYPDFIFEVKKDNKIQTFMVEIKPKKQTIQPKPKKNKKTYLQESILFEINTCKWNAAKRYCEDNGWIFKILTEEHLFKTPKKDK